MICNNRILVLRFYFSKTIDQNIYSFNHPLIIYNIKYYHPFANINNIYLKFEYNNININIIICSI